jgi:trimeric autotransporter adhesin
MANIRISQLPAAPSAITGTELIPVVQNGQTVQTTVSAITNSPVQTQTFLTVGAQSTLPNSRYIGGGLGIGTSDGGAQGLYSFFLNGTSASLENASAGIIAKTGVNTVTNRSIAIGTAGLSIADGSGVSGDPTISLTGLALSAATLTGSGMVSLVGGSFFQNVTLTGTSDQIDIANPNGGSNPTFSIANNPVIPGTASLSLPAGDTASRPAVSSNGMIRYNTDIALFEGYVNGAWTSFSSGSGVTSIITGTGLTGGPITSTGTISIANTAVTAGSYGSTTQVGTFTVNGQGQLTAASNVSITASGIGAVASVSGTANEITATGTTNVTLSLPTALTFTGKTVTDGAFNMTSATVGSDTVTTNTASQTLTNKTISGANNTLSNIGNSSLTNSSVTLGTSSVSLGGTLLAPAGFTSVSVTGNPTSALELATKQYVDGLASSGLVYHQPVQAATTQSLAAQTGGTVTYNAPGPEGVGATLTLSVALTVLDGYTLLNTNRILVKDEANQAHNGIYTWATGGLVLTRATDADTYGVGTNQISLNDYFFVQNGTVNKGTSYVITTVGTINFTTTPITFAEFSSSLVYTGGTGITVAGTVISISNTAVTAGAYGSATQVGTFTVNAQGQLTLAGNTTVTPAVGSITGLGTGVATALAINTGSAGSFVVDGGALGTPSSGTLTNTTGLPISTGVSGLGTGVATALAVNIGTAGAFVVNGGALGTPSSGTVTNLTGTASININGTVGATTPNTGVFTTCTATTFVGVAGGTF